MALSVRRFGQLLVGLAIYGLAIALQVGSGLGNDPWDVFHQGIALRTGVTLGQCVIYVGAAVLLLWIPLRQRPALGTLSNALLLGLFVDVFMSLLPAARSYSLQWLYLVLGVIGGAFATACYIGAGLGPGPRDGLMTGLAKRGYSLRWIRTLIELGVLAAGVALGGTAGLGTVLFAVSIGPLTQFFLKYLAIGGVEAVLGQSPVALVGSARGVEAGFDEAVKERCDANAH